MTLHYTKSGALDMRYSSSKAAVASGYYSGFGSSSGNFGHLHASPSKVSNTSSSNTSSSNTSSYNTSSATYHAKLDGTPDMRYNDSKLYVQSHGNVQESTSKSNAYVPTPNPEHFKQDGTPDIRYNDAAAYAERYGYTHPLKKNGELDMRHRINKDFLDSHNIERSNSGRTDYGSREDSKDWCHYISFELVNSILGSTPGYGLSEAEKDKMIQLMNTNGRIKSHAGNMNGSDGYSGDRYYDKLIINAIQSPTDKKIANQQAVDRAIRVWEIFQSSDLDSRTKSLLRDQLCQLRDQDGHVIIRANAALNKKE